MGSKFKGVNGNFERRGWKMKLKDLNKLAVYIILFFTIFGSAYNYPSYKEGKINKSAKLYKSTNSSWETISVWNSKELMEILREEVEKWN